jgi:TolA-binding protein
MGTGAWRLIGSGLLWAIALSGCGTLHPSSSSPSVSVANKGDVAAVDSGVVQSLERQIGERDKRIAELRSKYAELTSQLEALKVIDQDMSHGGRIQIGNASSKGDRR